MKKGKWFLYGIGWLVAGAAMISLMGLATMYLWNWLIPALFNGNVITFLQAIGLIALGKLLTGFMGMGGWRGRRRCGHHHHGHWRGKWESKMHNMSPEEREKFKQYYYDRCGWKMGHGNTSGENNPDPQTDKSGS